MAFRRQRRETTEQLHVVDQHAANKKICLVDEIEKSAGAAATDCTRVTGPLNRWANTGESRPPRPCPMTQPLSAVGVLAQGFGEAKALSASLS